MPAVADKPKGTMATSRMRKLTCPGCGVIMRATRTALRTSGLPTCGCGERFTCPDLEDLAAVAPDDERLAAAERAAVEYAIRSQEQMTRWARRGKDQPALSDRAGEAAARAGAAIQARAIAELTDARSRDRNHHDDIPF